MSKVREPLLGWPDCLLDAFDRCTALTEYFTFFTFRDEHQRLEVLKGILEDVGCSLDNVLLTKVYLTDINNSNEMNQVYSEYFPKKKKRQHERI